MTSCIVGVGVRAGEGLHTEIVFYLVLRFCDSPTDDIESRTPKGRGKRGRTNNTANNTTTVPTPEVSVTETRGKLRNASNKGRRGGTTTPTFNPPPSPIKNDTTNNNKRKGREPESPAPDPKNAKRSRANPRAGANGSNCSSPVPEQNNSNQQSSQTPTAAPQQLNTIHRPSSPILIECPEPNCNKKFKSQSALKFHRSASHSNSLLDEENPSSENHIETEVDDTRQSPAPVVEAPVDIAAQDVVKPSVLRFSGVPPQSPGSDSSPTVISEDVKPILQTSSNTPSTQASVIQPRLQTPTTQPVYLYPGGTTTTSSPQRLPVSTPNTVQVPVNSNPISSTQIRPGSQTPTGVNRPAEVKSEPNVRIPPGTTPIVPNNSVARPNNPQSLPSNPSPVPGGPSPRLSVPITPQGTPLSSLPGSTLNSVKVKTNLEADTNSKLLNNKGKEPINGLVGSIHKEEESSQPPLPSREEARSPAYSDISDANEAAPTLDDGDGKDDKKGDLAALGATPYGYYGIPYGAYGQHPYLMSPIPPGHQSLPIKEVDLKDKSDKDKKDGLPLAGSAEYLAKFPQHYVYPPYNLQPDYNNAYVREFLYKSQLEKGKVEGKDLPGSVVLRESDKGPTDLSRTSTAPGYPPASQNGKDKNISSLKEKSTENHAVIKEPHELKSQLPPDKRYDPTYAYKYPNHYDSRMPLPGSPSADKCLDKSALGIPKPSPPAPLSSPRMGSTTPTGVSKDDKGEKKSDPKTEGVKPTMETTGPPPPPTSSAYYPSYPFASVPFDPYRPMPVPGMPIAGFPPGAYLPSHPGPPPPGLPAGIRYPVTGIHNGPEDLSRGGAPGAAMFHPSHLYSSHHKIAELQERALKSPVTSHSGPVSTTAQSLLTPPNNKVASPLAMSIKDSGGTGTQPVTSAPFNPTSPFNSSSSVGLLQSPVGPGGERSSPPTGAPPRHPAHPSLPEGYTFSPLLASQFSAYTGKNSSCDKALM